MMHGHIDSYDRSSKQSKRAKKCVVIVILKLAGNRDYSADSDYFEEECSSRGFGTRFLIDYDYFKFLSCTQLPDFDWCAPYFPVFKK